MKKNYKSGIMLGIGLLSIISLAKAQGTQYPFWKPVNGSPNENTSNKAAVPSGTPEAINPGGRFNPSFDNVGGTLYMFAGQRGSVVNDLWAFNPNTFYWEKLTYTGTAPNSRHSHRTAVDGADLYVFGGGGITNDLYKLNTSTLVWTKIRNSTGSTAIVSGDPATYTPGGSMASNIWSKDGIIYLFGGRHNTSNPHQNLNDFWKYDIATDRWTVLGGTQTTNDAGVYGTKGVGDVSNIPHSRNSAASWIVGQKLYLFGGNTTYTGTNSKINDLWEYDITTGKWAWLTGSNTVNATAVYGTTGVFDENNTPGALAEAQSWTAGGKLYLNGGGGYNDVSSGSLSDLWEFDPTQGSAGGQWRLLKGTKALGSTGSAGALNDYGTKDYYPRGRGASSAVAIGNKFFLYGGYVGISKDYNDVWLVDLDVTEQVLPVNFISFNAKADGNRAKLTWSTASEKDNAYFEIEKSTDGNNFSLLTKVNANGNTTSTSNYLAYDNNPAQTTYYRLAQVDNDGVRTTLGSAVVSFKLDKAIQVSTYPNPATTQVSLSIASYTGKVLVTVKDVNGKSLKQYAGNANQGQALLLDVSDLASGLYFFEVSGDNFKQTEKVIVK